MALRWFALTAIHFNNVRAFNAGNLVPASIVQAHALDAQGLVVQIDVDVDDPAVVLRPILTSDFDTDAERENFIPARLSEVALKEAFTLADPVLSEFVYDDAGNLTSYQEDGVPIVLTYNPDGTVATSKRGTAPAKTYSYTGGNLAGVA